MHFYDFYPKIVQCNMAAISLTFHLCVFQGYHQSYWSREAPVVLPSELLLLSDESAAEQDG
jgi:hypothetical protein